MNKNDSLSSLNDTNDLTRIAYSNKSSDIPLRNNSMTDRFESDTFINHKESFEQNNSRINSLNDEIRELKSKLRWIGVYLGFNNILKYLGPVSVDVVPLN